MGEIVNLRQVRKARARAAAAEQAQAQRAKHGATKAERAAETARRKALDRTLDGAHLPERDDRKS